MSELKSDRGFRAILLTPEEKVGGVDLNVVSLRERKGYSARRASVEAGYERLRMESTLWGRVRLWWRDRRGSES